MKQTITMKQFDEAVFELKRHRPDPRHGSFHVAPRQPMRVDYMSPNYWDLAGEPTCFSKITFHSRPVNVDGHPTTGWFYNDLLVDVA